MELQHIKIENLKLAALNVRKRGAKETGDLVPSIRANGVLQPLLVRPNFEGFEIIAGQRRYHALLELADEGVHDPVPCMVMDNKDDAKAIEASLAENIARLPMDEIDQFKAFAALSKQGLSVEDIALQFGLTEKLVSQRLALGSLYAPILTAFRNDEVGSSTIQYLTMATPKQQKAWWKLFKSDDPTPQGYSLKQWLFGGEIPIENALFNVADYRGSIVSDLFGEDSYFDDAQKFWELQNVVIAEAKRLYHAEGWSEVIVMDIGQQWYQWDHAETPQNEGGRVYIQISHNGEVKYHVGYLTEKEAKRKAVDENGETLPATKAEITKAMQNYLALHRHAAVRSELLDHSGIALRLAVAQMIAGSELWNVEADPQKANTDAIAESLATNKAEDRFATERAFVKGLLKTKDKKTDTIVSRKQDWGRSHDLKTIFAKLIPLDDETLTRIMTFIVAETLPCNDGLVEILGALFKTDMADHWQVDDTFFDLFRDKQAVNAMLSEVAGEHVASGNISATAKVQKQIIKDCLNGTRSPQQADWEPRYMAFPMQAYTDKGGIDAVDSWKKAEKLFA